MWTWGLNLCLALPLISAVYCMSVIIARWNQRRITTFSAIFESLLYVLLVGAIGGLAGAIIGVLVGCAIWHTAQCGLLLFFTAPIGSAIGMIVGLQLSFGKGGKWGQFLRDRL